jgi:hypothetical protein
MYQNSDDRTKQVGALPLISLVGKVTVAAALGLSNTENSQGLQKTQVA